MANMGTWVSGTRRARSVASTPENRLSVRCLLRTLVLIVAVQTTTIVGAQMMATADRIRSDGWWPTKGTPPRKDYVGSAACTQCHANHAAVQPTTSMARTATTAQNSSVLRRNGRLTFTKGPYSYEIVTDDRRSLYTVSDGTRSFSVPLIWAFGVGKVGQSFLFEKNGAFHEARVSYYDSVGTLGFTPGRAIEAPRDPDEAGARRVGELEGRRWADHVHRVPQPPSPAGAGSARVRCALSELPRHGRRRP